MRIFFEFWKPGLLSYNKILLHVVHSLSYAFIFHLYIYCYKRLSPLRLTGNTTECLLCEFLSVWYRKSQDRERDLKLLLDMYKTVPKDTREKAQVSVILCVCCQMAVGPC